MVNQSKNDEEVLEILRKLQTNKDHLHDYFTDEDIACLKDMVEDRKAVSRVLSKMKLFFISVTAIITGYMFLYEGFIDTIKKSIKSGGG